MSTNKTIILQHNEHLSTLVDTINSLPDKIDLSNDTVTPATLVEGITAHDASGTAIVGTMTPNVSYNTCTVTLGRKAVYMSKAYMTIYTSENSINTLLVEDISLDTTIENVVCGSMIALVTSSAIIPTYAVSGGAEFIYNNYDHTFWLFSIPQNPTGNVSIVVRDDD